MTIENCNQFARILSNSQSMQVTLQTVYDICRLQTADRRLQTTDCMRQQDITLFREVRPRNEVYFFHANYTDLIPKGAVGCSFRIELWQNNVC